MKFSHKNLHSRKDWMLAVKKKEVVQGIFLKYNFKISISDEVNYPNSIHLRILLTNICGFTLVPCLFWKSKFTSSYSALYSNSSRSKIIVFLLYLEKHAYSVLPTPSPSSNTSPFYLPSLVTSTYLYVLWPNFFYRISILLCTNACIFCLVFKTAAEHQLKQFFFGRREM